jgi:hypothetical protein
MRTARRTTVGLVGLLLLGWGAWWLTRPSPGDGAAMRGAFAPLDTTLAGPWVPVATVADAALELGRVTALDARHDTLALSHPHGATLFVAGRLQFQVGDTTRGAPEYVGYGAAITLLDSGVVQLDQRGRGLIYRDWTGTRTRVRSLAGPKRFPRVLQMQRHGGHLLVTVLEEDAAAPAWWIWRVGPASTDTLFGPYARGARSAAYRAPLLAVAPSGFTLVDALDGRRYALDSAGRLRDSTPRADAPRLAIAAAQQQRLRQLTASLAEPLRLATELDGYLPYAQQVGRAADGHLLVVSPDADDASQVEILDPTGRPLARLFAQRDPWPLFASDGTLFRVRESDDAYIIERLTLRLPRR